ncbi:MAG: hypothetical protein JEZ10_04910 [Verrucomicrobia bacterium]|nr:hypothetical protein [Verrucomicrobiota bacterium]
MNKLKPLIDVLSATILNGPPGWEDREVRGVFASDLISDILVSDGEETLLLTSLLSDQVLRTADVIGAVAVVLVNRRHIPAALTKAATKQGLPLFSAPLSKFNACVRLGPLMEMA